MVIDSKHLSLSLSTSLKWKNKNVYKCDEESLEIEPFLLYNFKRTIQIFQDEILFGSNLFDTFERSRKNRIYFTAIYLFFPNVSNWC